MEKKTLSAILICCAIAIFWQKFFIDPQLLRQQHQQQQLRARQQKQLGQPEASGERAQVLAEQPSAEPVAASPHVSLTLETQNGQVTLGDAGAWILDWKLKAYSKVLQSQDQSVDLSSITRETSGELTLSFDDPRSSSLLMKQGRLTRVPEGAHWLYEDDQVRVERKFLVSPAQPFMDVEVLIDFKDLAPPRYAFVSMLAKGSKNDGDVQERHLDYGSQSEIHRVLWQEDQEKYIATPVKYLSANNQYFVFTVVAREAEALGLAQGSPRQELDEPRGLIQRVDDTTTRLSLSYGVNRPGGLTSERPAGQHDFALPLRVYFGPKDLDVLRKVAPTLDHNVDFGSFTVIAYPLLQVLKWLYRFVGNYGSAIILLTLLLKLVTYPLSLKTAKSMKSLAKIQPVIQQLKERYKNDPETLNRETMALMRTSGANPLTGCLPVLIQMPVFLALNKVLASSVELYHAPFIFWIQDLSSRDPLYLTSLLLGGTMFVQQKMMPVTNADPAQQKMMQWMMPVLFTGMMVTLPAGMTLYMLVNTLAGIAQQWLVNRKLDNTPQVLPPGVIPLGRKV